MTIHLRWGDLVSAIIAAVLYLAFTYAVGTFGDHTIPEALLMAIGRLFGAQSVRREFASKAGGSRG